MRSLFRLLPALRTAPTTRAPRREQVSFQLDAQRSIELLRVHDPRAKRIKLSVDERGARLTLPLRASRTEGERFLHEHRGWLVAQLDRQADAAGSGLVRDGTAICRCAASSCRCAGRAGAPPGWSATATACASPPRPMPATPRCVAR